MPDIDKQPGGNTGHGFRPGVSGNPAGRPRKEHTLTSCVREPLDGNAEKVKKKWKESGHMTGAQMAAIGIVAKLVKGDPAVLKEVWQRTEGRVPLPVEHTGMDGGPIQTQRVEDLTDEQLRDIAAGRS